MVAEADLGDLLAQAKHRVSRIFIPPVDHAGLKPGNAEDWSRFLAGPSCALPFPIAVGQDAVVIFYTSGTTGHPKGVLLSHDAELFTARMVARHMRIGPADRVIVAGPLAFIYPLIINALSAFGRASVRAVTRVKPEQASKRTMRMPTCPENGEGRARRGSNRHMHPFRSAGVVGTARTQSGSGNEGDPSRQR